MSSGSQLLAQRKNWASLVRKLPRVAKFYKWPTNVVWRRWHLNIKPYVEDLKWTEAENVRPASVEARARLFVWDISRARRRR